MIDVLSCTSTATRESDINYMDDTQEAPPNVIQTSKIDHKTNSNAFRQSCSMIQLRPERVIKRDKQQILKKWNILLEIPYSKHPKPV